MDTYIFTNANCEKLKLNCKYPLPCSSYIQIKTSHQIVETDILPVIKYFQSLVGEYLIFQRITIL